MLFKNIRRVADEVVTEMELIDDDDVRTMFPYII